MFIKIYINLGPKNIVYIIWLILLIIKKKGGGVENLKIQDKCLLALLIILSLRFSQKLGGNLLNIRIDGLLGFLNNNNNNIVVF